MSDIRQGRFDTLPEMQAAYSKLLQRQRDNSHMPEFLDDVYHFIDFGQHTGKVLDDAKEREMARTMIAFWATRLVREGRELPDITLDDFDPSIAPTLPDEPCPYQGLGAFRQREFFYGRESTIADLLKLLRDGCRFLTVVGPSGSGKSSVVLGGLIPTLQADGLPGSRDWKCAVMVPGTDPVANLGSALDNEIAATCSNLVPQVLVVDQFEEIFTLASASSRGAFEDRLLDLHKQGTIIVLTLRLDYASDDAAKLQQIYPLIESGRVDLKALSIQELRDAIILPATQVGLKFDEGIVDDMVAKVLGERAGLPLLQFALLKLWKGRDRNRITREDYERSGDPLQALKRSAESFYAGLLPQEQDTVKRTLLKLVKPAGFGTEVTSNRIPIEELYRNNNARDRVESALKKLTNEGLIRTTGQGTQIEIAHEALIRNWPTLSQWLDEERNLLRQRFLLREKAQAWATAQRDSEASLLRGRELENAEQLNDLDDVETRFIKASRAEIDRLAQEKEAASRLVEKRLRRISLVAIASSIFGMLGMIGITAVGTGQASIVFALPLCCLQPLFGLIAILLAVRWDIFGRRRAPAADTANAAALR